MSPASQRPARTLLLEWMAQVLRAIDPRVLVRQSIESQLPRRSAVAILAVGKAALTMTQGAIDAVESGGGHVSTLLVIAPHGTDFGVLPGRPGAKCLTAAHPIPDSHSLLAGEALLSTVGGLPGDVTPLFLVSGGSSSLAEAPREGVTLGDIVALNRECLASGAPIGVVNARRREVSRLKGGGLAAALRGRGALALFLSDVPGDDPAVIGSGLMGPAPGGDRVQRIVVGSNVLAVEAVRAAARREGLSCEVLADPIAGEAASVGRDISGRLIAAAAQVVIAGGESTVTLPESPGRGGRNQHLALAASQVLRVQGDCSLLAFGTDGIDGPTEDAGALVDEGTWQRVLDAGLDPAAALARADAGTALEAAGDLVQTGPTGTNVGDLVIGLRRAG